MDYILRQIDKKIKFYDGIYDRINTINYLRLKLEYGLIFALAYLWNKNISVIDEEAREYLVNKIFSPTIGDVVDICRKLDINKEFFLSKQINEGINEYPSIRNEKIGHGYTFEDGVDNLYNQFKELANKVFDPTKSFFANKHFDLIKVFCLNNNQCSGINYKSAGDDYFPWFASPEVAKFDHDNVYALTDEGIYFKLSPFIHVADDEFYLFRDIYEKLTGNVRYNRILKTGSYFKEWHHLCFDVYNDGKRKKSSNGTIINTYENNYKKYIDIGTKKKIISFLKENKSSVCATIWGHGGVGKTATVQSICEDLLVSKQKVFDYIVFASAKDRVYRYYTGEIITKSDRIESFEAFINCINMVIRADDSNNANSVIELEANVLIIIDDYETFPAEQKVLIEDFLKKLDINKHKVLITTRANLIIGMEFQTDELNARDSSNFIIDIFKNEFPAFNITQIKNELQCDDKQLIIHNITSGRPLFLYQLAYLITRKGSIQLAALHNIKKSKQAIDFLYGRIYEYITDDAQHVFAAISQLVTENDLVNLLDKIKYIINLENDETRFNNAIQELCKLRIVELVDNEFFKVYSDDIYHIMLDYFNALPHNVKSSITSRIKHVTRDKKLDNDHALLANANSARFSKSEEEVVRAYRQILNRISCPEGIKLEALLNLADYLINNRGKKTEAVKVFTDFEHLFHQNHTFIKSYSNYCWANSQKYEAIKVIVDYFSSKPNLKGCRSTYLELLGQLTTFKSIYYIELKEALKDKKRLGEIDNFEFQSQNAVIKDGFCDIYKQHGHFLFKAVKNTDISNISSAAKQNVIAGLFQFVNICIRMNKHDFAEDICRFCINNFPHYLQPQFQFKLSAIEAMQSSKISKI